LNIGNWIKRSGGTLQFYPSSNTGFRINITPVTSSAQAFTLSLLTVGNYTSGNSNTTITWDMTGNVGLFIINSSDGKGGLYMADYSLATITELRANSGIVVNTSNPGNNKLGLYKSSSSNTISIVQDGNPPFGAYYINAIGR